VIKVVTAELLDNTTSVELEDELVGLDGNGDGLLDEGSLHGINVSNSDVGISSVGLVSLGRIESACSGDSLVRIVSFSFNTSLSSVFETITHQTTIAALISSNAINQVLFREGDEVLVVDEVETFEGTNGRESPAGTARSLVLDGGDGTLSSPIDGGGEVLSSEGVDGFSSSVTSGGVTSVDGTEFFRAQISKVVQSELDIILDLVEFEDGEIVVGEDVESVFFFHTSRVTLVVGEFPLLEEVSHELLLEDSTLAGNEEDSEENDGFHFFARE